MYEFPFVFSQEHMMTLADIQPIVANGEEEEKRQQQLIRAL